MSKGNKDKCIRITSFIVCLFLTGIANTICAQDTIPEMITGDTIVPAAEAITPTDTLISDPNDPADISGDTVMLIGFSDLKNDTFKPNPKTAWMVAMIFPGFGQIYNRQYWKLPIIYGGMMGCAYAISWNNKTYQDYKQAYFDVVEDATNDPKAENPDSWHTSWQDFLPSSTNPATKLNDSQFRNQLKNGKDKFRRYRDLSIIVTGLVYMICVADSYVDAQMFDFDVSPDLSFRVTPEFRPETLSTSRSFGLNVCMTF